ncbi:MAG: hypothetical protein EPN93_04675 [Spirochaetes bacterium]|nr:MAG: hypothetical protein EPN93_04675 [Spirochaetota bacterium]
MKQMLAFILVFCASAVFAQDIGFVNELAKKETATFGDAVKLFVPAAGGQSAGFQADAQFLEAQGIIKASRYAEGETLRKGTLALMIANQMKLGDSLLFAVIGTRRYAVTACVAAEIMLPGSGEWEIVSGSELIETIRVMMEKKGGAK